MEPVRPLDEETPAAHESAGVGVASTAPRSVDEGAQANGSGSNGRVVSPESGVVANAKAVFSIFDTAIIGIAAWDGSGIVREANRAFLDTLGYGEEHLQGDLRIDALVRSDVPPVTNGTPGVELALLRRDGGTVWCVTNGSLPRTAGVEGIGLFVDISKRREREDEMRVLYDALRATVNAVVICDSHGNIQWVNPAFTRTTGYAAEEVIGRNPRVLRSGLMKPEFYENLWRTIQSGDVWKGDIVNRRRDGSLYVEDMSITPVRRDGQITHYVAIKQDVSERQRTEAALRESEQRFRDIFEQSLDAIVVTDPEHSIIDANPAVERLLGWSREELIGRSSLSLAADAGGSEHIVSVLRDQGVVRDYETRARTRDGGTVEIQMNAVPRWDDRGHLLGYQAIMRDITARKRFEEELQHLAFHDWLTGLPNLALFRDRLEHAVAQADRTSTRLGLVYLDLDRFKTLNDSHGHNAGDRAIQQVARRLLACFREEDTVARIGGDEFTIIIERVSGPAQLTHLLERVAAALRTPVLVDGNRVEMEASIGAIIYDGAEELAHGAGRTAEDLIRKADAAMYQAKRRSGTRFHIFDPAVDQDGSARLRQQQELRRAIDNDELTTLYQPVIDIESGTLWGIEVLARWIHPERGTVGPNEFIPVAEESGLIGRLGEWILDHACQDMARWTSEGIAAGVRLMVNLSARQLEDRELPDRIAALLDRCGVNPTQLHLEVTETVAVQHPGRVQGLRAIGASVSVDDFGTGYSSLRYLKDLDVDGLKVDMGFVQDMENDPKLAAIVRTVITLGYELGLDVVAEGIETETQLKMLQTMGCRLGQGYLFSRPIDADALRAELRRRAG
jgi:diguanylate cyclase (GGDEF)-like protein/PAS domain S-box-containing protein